VRAKGSHADLRGGIVSEAEERRCRDLTSALGEERDADGAMPGHLEVALGTIRRSWYC
jgi:hypothetical protein